MSDNAGCLKAALSGCIVWLDIKRHTTKEGREKFYLYGMPADTFWPYWKSLSDGEKAILKSCGLRVRPVFEREQIAANQKKRRDYGKVRYRKAWIAELWINKHNSSEIIDYAMRSGIRVPEQIAPTTFESEVDFAAEYEKKLAGCAI